MKILKHNVSIKKSRDDMITPANNMEAYRLRNSQ